MGPTAHVFCNSTWSSQAAGREELCWDAGRDETGRRVTPIHCVGHFRIPRDRGQLHTVVGWGGGRPGISRTAFQAYTNLMLQGPG